MGSEPLVQLRDWTLVRRTETGERVLLEDIDLDIHPGRWVALLGANGAGKTSLLKYLAGDDSPVADRSALVCQDPDEQLVAVTVHQELALGRGDQRDPDLAAYALEGTGDRDPRVLSAGQKQRLALAVALGLEPDLLLCDEPTALQDPHQAAWMLDSLDAWRRRTGGALLTATCDRTEAARADELIVLEDGCIVERGAPAVVLAGDRAQALLPVSPPAVPPRVAPPGAATVLSLQNLVWGPGGDGPAFGPCDLTVRAGERVGFVGPNGCGKSTLLATCVGLMPPRSGEVRLGDQRLYMGRGRDLDHGRAALAPQFPEYMFTAGSVRREIALDPALARRDPAALVAQLGLPAGCLEANPHGLSTGQRRRLALGLALASGRPLIALDEPTSALDRDGRDMALELLAATDPEVGLIIASHDRDFLAAVGCRVVELAP